MIEETIDTLKKEIRQALNLDCISEAEMDPDSPLFGDEGLGLDSIDALEIIVLLEKNYGIKLKTAEDGKKIFTSIRSIAEYVENHRVR